MPTQADLIRQSLLASDPEYRKLAEEHTRCEEQLKEILEEPYRNSEDLAQETILKKMKLRLRDQMEHLVHLHQHDVVHH
ncbi:MAG TPA: hypothetical protein VL913_00125 [Candidatus Micrarchaeaceae archaeon]|nr:hypothetical protein [Candidatus Micrarchaeaceae archaeon]